MSERSKKTYCDDVVAETMNVLNANVNANVNVHSYADFFYLFQCEKKRQNIEWTKKKKHFTLSLSHSFIHDKSCGMV